MHFIHLLKRGHSLLLEQSLVLYYFVIVDISVYCLLVHCLISDASRRAQRQLSSSPFLCSIALVLLFISCPHLVCIGIFCDISDVSNGTPVRKAL